MILVTGANGQVGQCIRQLAPQFPELSLIFMGSADLDITNREAVRQIFQQNELTGCINCAAYTAVDKAETNQPLAEAINVQGTQWLAEGCSVRNIPFIHFSSDYVYHNAVNRPLVETDKVQPKGVYARTKLRGERVALRKYPNSMIIRTSWVYAPFGNNFVHTMLRLGAERPALNVVFDQIGTPTYAPDLAAAVLSLLRQHQRNDLTVENLAGIWHYSNEGVTSWYDFALAIFELANLPCKVNPILSVQYPTPAQRPAFSVLDKSKIKNAFGLDIPHWRQSLQACLAALESEK
jgi:dTDP-4-dehydrorhamnose reductase